MEPQRFDAMSRSLSGGLSRRQILTRLGMGGIATGLAATVGRQRGVAQAASCRLQLVATVRLGSSAGAMFGGAVPGELRGTLEFGMGNGGAIDDARLRLEDGTEMPVVGQMLGRAVHLRVAIAEDQHLVLVGTAEEDLGSCRGVVGGLLSGPQPGDLGDWQATASGEGGDPSPTGPFSTEEDEQATEEAPETEEAAVCPEGQELCNDTCVDLGSDSNHCGFCNGVCPTDWTCVGGECVCPEGYVNCLGTCCTVDETCVEGICKPPPEVCIDPAQCESDAECCDGRPCRGGLCGAMDND